MADPALEEDFKSRFAVVLKDLMDNGHKDPEAMWLMGSLAARIMNDVKMNDWSEFKTSLTKEGYDALLNAFQRQGQELHSSGNQKAAYAVQAIAVSVVASKMTDPDVISGNELMDEFIGQTVRIFEKNAEANNAKPN